VLNDIVCILAEQLPINNKSHYVYAHL